MIISPETKKHFVQSLTSKKFVTVLYSLTWLFVLLLIIVLKPEPSEAIINALLMAIAGVFTAFVGANTVADHYLDGKNNKNKDTMNEK